MDPEMAMRLKLHDVCNLIRRGYFVCSTWPEIHTPGSFNTSHHARYIGP